MSRIVFARIRAGAVCLLCCGLATGAWAARPVRVYEVDLRGGQTPAALQDAMRDALVRATGRRDAGEDPALATLVGSAGTYVKSYATGSRGQPQVVFDSAAVDRAIAAAGRTVWGRDRPFTLVVLSPQPPRAVEDAARTNLDTAAGERGLPITLVPLTVTDSSGNDLAREAIMHVAQRYGGDAVLVGRGDPSGGSGQLQWTLYTDFATQSWTGTLAAGIDGAVDNFAPTQAGTAGQLESAAVVQIDGLNSLSDFAVAQRMLEGMPGSRRTTVVGAGGMSATFQVVVRGGAEAVDHALVGSGRFVNSGTQNARPVYTYRPQ
ncbi:MAG TPA: DUF2066 domain-containing protein [Steroidobacteraceae bacterium]